MTDAPSTGSRCGCSSPRSPVRRCPPTCAAAARRGPRRALPLRQQHRRRSGRRARAHHAIRDAGPARRHRHRRGGRRRHPAPRAATGSPVLGAAALGAADDLALTRETGNAIGAELAALGITLTSARSPTSTRNPANPVIGTRSFGSDPSLVAAHVAAWLIGLQEAGVAACAKHFPGHGDTDLDSHLALPVVDVDAATLAARELVPFAAAVRGRASRR